MGNVIALVVLMAVVLGGTPAFMAWMDNRSDRRAK